MTQKLAGSIPTAYDFAPKIIREDPILLTFYYAPGSSSLASHIALEEADANYERRLVDEKKGEQHSEA